MATWREKIEYERNDRDDGPIIACTLDDGGLDKSFDDGFGGSKGLPFTAWSAKRVYFPVVWDGSEWVASVPRDPSDEATQHVGGE